MKRLISALIFLLSLNSILFAQTGTCEQPGDLQKALSCLCIALYDYVSIVAFIMILISSIVYALGQMFGAETRARANVWATSMLTGAIIGIILIVLVPAFLASLLGLGSFDPNNCTFSRVP